MKNWYTNQEIARIEEMARREIFHRSILYTRHNAVMLILLTLFNKILNINKKEQAELVELLTSQLIAGNKYHPSKLIDMLVSPDQAIDMQANLAETFPLWVERHGLAAAHRIRKVQIVRLIIGEYWNKAIELIKAVKLVGS